MKVRRSLLKDTVEVSTYQGDSAYGETYADPVTVWCNVDETRRLVRSSNGDETVSEATLQLHPLTRTIILADPQTVGDLVDPTVVFAPESQVVIRGRVSRVITCKPHTMRGTTVMVEVVCS